VSVLLFPRIGIQKSVTNNGKVTLTLFGFAFGAAAQEPANNNTDQKHQKNQHRAGNKKSPEEKADVYDRNVLKDKKDGQRRQHKTDDFLVIQFFHFLTTR
jgi:hypothetical protein